MNVRARTQPGRRLRAQWPLAGWALLSVGFFGLLASEVLGSTGTVVLDDYGCALAPAAAGWACWRASRRSTARFRLAWLLLAASMVSWSGGGVAWTVYEVHLGREVPFPSWADLGYLTSVPLAVAALLSFPGAHLGRARLRLLLDGVIAAGALLFISWVTVLGPAVDAGTGSLLSKAIALGYPAGDVLTATIALLTLARARGRQRTTMLLVSIGLLIVAVADSSFAWFTAHDAYVTGNLFDTGYVAGFLLIAVAALQAAPAGADGHATGHLAALAAAEAQDKAAPTELASRWALGLPYVPVLISTPLAVALQLQGQPLRGVPFYLCAAVIAAVLLRQLLSMRMIVALSGQLHETVDALRAREAELGYQAFHDPLTGLANRALFADRINHALAHTRRSEPVIVLLADLDDFKAVNDSLGHPAGDALLVGVAERLRGIVRPEDTVARLGGDEFAVLLETAKGVAEAQQVAARIGDALVQPFNLSGTRTIIGASIGITVAGDAATGEELLRDADIAMYAAKSAGKARHAVYAVELASAAIDRRQLKDDLRGALGAGQLSLKYQPVIDLSDGRLRGVEALLRWRHPVRGDIPPSTFIPLAEDTGDIVPIGRWVLEQACTQAGRWHRHRSLGAPGFGLAVNLSGRQLSDPTLVATVRAALAAAELPAELLTLEITEGVLLNDDDALGPLRALRDLGLHLAIDDFGTGHSALSRLRDYPIDTLKIDQSFIAALTDQPAAADVLISTILSMGHGLNIDIIAEGVETDDQLMALRSMGCAQGQGFLFARPADPDVIDQLIRSELALTDPAAAPAA